MAVKNPIAASGTTLNSSVFNNRFHKINPLGLQKGCYILRLVNDSDRDVIVSYDGSHTDDYVPEKTTMQLYFSQSDSPGQSALTFPEGTIVYVKGSSPGTGLLYLAVYYQT